MFVYLALRLSIIISEEVVRNCGLSGRCVRVGINYVCYLALVSREDVLVFDVLEFGLV